MRTVDQVDQPAAPVADAVTAPPGQPGATSPGPALGALPSRGAVPVRRRRAQLHRVATARVGLVPVPRSPGTGRTGRHAAVPAAR